MSYTVALSKEQGFEQLGRIVKSYARERTTFLKNSYNETQLRNDFLNPFLMCFGWDVLNEKRRSHYFRDVLLEESVEVENDSNKQFPDYTLRINGDRKLFIEAKKPHVDITTSKNAAFQIRRYGWSAPMAVSILSNFENIVLYDCRFEPSVNDNTQIAKIGSFKFDEYLEKFDEIYNLFSYEVISKGEIETIFSLNERKLGQTFDEYFLNQIEKWRINLATSLVSLNKNLTISDINFLIQRLLNRIVFLRICEDRTIEKYETLKKIRSYSELKNLFQQSDRKYNSGLFNFIDDTLSLNIEIDSNIIIEIFNELYYPLSPYNFAVVDPSILSQIYEKFLGSFITLDKQNKIKLVEEPEVAASKGVVSTPKIIVDNIIKDTLTDLVKSKSIDELYSLKIADICCGSGTFLISVYDFLLKELTEKFETAGINDFALVNKTDSSFCLTLKTKRKILESCIYGVDINPYATEVAEFSLLLKLLEGEKQASIEQFINQNSSKILPALTANIKCGNSLVDQRFYTYNSTALEDDNLLFRVRPFDWIKEFPFLNSTNGFNAIVGNPPYVRIQNMMKYTKEEVGFYQKNYSVGKKGTIDKYYIFIQKAIELLNSEGYLGYIVPNKFFIAEGGSELRKFIIENTGFSKIIHFGVTQVFPEKSTYTSIIILQKQKKINFEFKRAKSLNIESLNSFDFKLQQDKYTSDPWIFISPATKQVFDKLNYRKVERLDKLAKIAVGLQTSSDKTYVFVPIRETLNTFVFTLPKSQIEIEIEKGICLPCIYDLYFDSYDTIETNAQLIFPYKVINNTAIAFEEEYLKKEFPLCYKYLQGKKEDLIKRSINGKNPKWYQFGRSQSLTRFHNAKKLIWKVLSKKSSYIYDDKNIKITGGGNGPYYSLLSNSEYSILYFLAILSHPVIEFLVKSGSSFFQGEYYSHGKQFIAGIPIRVIDKDDNDESRIYDDILKVSEQIINSTKEYNSAYGDDKNVLERKIDALKKKSFSLINTLYGITEEDVEKVLGDELLNQTLIANQD